MTSVSPQRPKIMRWLSPLLLLSLGLHALGLFVPVPRKAEVPQEVEELTLDSIQVSVLPAESVPDLPDESDLLLEAPTAELPVAEPLPASEVDPQLQVQTVPDLTSEPQQISTDTPDPVSPDNSAFSDPIVSNKPNKPVSSTPQVFSDPANIGRSEKLAAYTNFSTSVEGFENLVSDNWTRERYDAYELDYLEDLCFTDKERVTGVVGMILNNIPQLQTGELVTGTGFAATDEAIKAWFAHLAGGGEGNTDKVESTWGETIYDWFYAQKQQVWFQENQDYEAFLFRVDLNLVNNPCK
ncbi:hypothetical protein [cf. Phormidesmis sp. LEGE 11477]|uniref:hypothetical protein n=1 Tax=cf. Phormidesmis sp. LEGE 11477 TaxID=1828680 RepID=UPI00187F455D|nr:hypothetical protein [cf. Phormidesmis sp. LEGE 11477]MBE9063519.1 hypothetical protein [cf. Phormidesmis sp. LEGE 11477]